MNPNLNRWLENRIAALKEQNLYKPLVVMDTPSWRGSRSTAGRTSSTSPATTISAWQTIRSVKAAAIPAVEKWGAGAGAVRPIIGTMRVHIELEQRLAAFKHVEATLVFQSGFTANAGVIPTITDGEDAIITDELNHASIIDGVRLSKAARKIYKHCDMNSLEEALKETARREEAADHHGRRLQHGRRHRARCPTSSHWPSGTMRR